MFPSQVNLQCTYQYDFDQMKMTFGNLIETISPLIEAGIPTFKELIRYLWRCFQDLRPQLTIATLFDDVMELVQDKCTIINVCCLEAIVDHYIVTRYTPLNLIDFLLTVAERNLKLLKENGVMKLTFGYHTIYDKHQRDEVRVSTIRHQLLQVLYIGD